MKKVLSIFASLMVLVVLTGCSNNPKSVVKDFVKACNDQNWEEAVDYMGTENGNAISTKEKKAFLEYAETFEKGYKEVDLEIIDVNKYFNGQKATVKAKDNNKKASEKDMTYDLRKGEDGKWRIINIKD